jgi:hypothetical protein
MEAYLHKNWCGLGDRVIVHPQGLPPGWKESNLTVEQQSAAKTAVRDKIQPTQAQIRSGAHPQREVFHLNPETLEVIDTFKLQ